MTESLRRHQSGIGHRSMANIMSRVMDKFDPRPPHHRHRQRDRQADSATASAHYVIEYAGWASVGWSEDDPTADEAMAALASLSKVDFPSVMDGLRKSGETSLKALEKRRSQDDHS
jgi:hypothetical protein